MTVYKKIKKGDKVRMLSGKDSGKEAKVLRVFSDAGKVVVEGLNLVTKNVRPKRAGEKGQQIKVPRAVDISNVGVICSHCHQVTRIGFQLLDGGKKGAKKIRICRKCKEVIE
jgi:large subunit ribosomal protein L24